MTDCIFCSIVAGEAERSLAYQDDLVTAFAALEPANPGHMLVVPNVHATDLAELPPATGARLYEVGQRIALALYASDLPCDGVNFWQTNGAAAGQDVFHVHFHVFPRTAGDAIRLGAHWQVADRADLDAAANAVRQALAGPG